MPWAHAMLVMDAEHSMAFHDVRKGSLLQLAEKGLVFLACNDNPDAQHSKWRQPLVRPHNPATVADAFCS